jgi:hypothetical protein
MRNVSWGTSDTTLFSYEIGLHPAMSPSVRDPQREERAMRHSAKRAVSGAVLALLFSGVGQARAEFLIQSESAVFDPVTQNPFSAHLRNLLTPKGL